MAAVPQSARTVMEPAETVAVLSKLPHSQILTMKVREQVSARCRLPQSLLPFSSLLL